MTASAAGAGRPKQTLAAWLAYQLAVHPQAMELGLDRVRTVAERLGLLPAAHATITVAGTNGKGSCVALLAGLIGPRARVGCYTSPHLWRYNERVTIDGLPATDDELVAAFEAIEDARADISLTFFEFGTLAALWLFARASVDVAVLEVGLGGRLDAVNIVDADVALITQIGLDHTAWLGDTREAIGREKAGIMRAGRPALCSDRTPPTSIADTAAQCGASLTCIGRDFDLQGDDARWYWSDDTASLEIRPVRGVHRDNLALAIAGARAAGYEVSPDDMQRACERQLRLAGRREVIDGPVPIIYDVAHNDDAVALLVTTLQEQNLTGTTHVVIGMLADKPVETVGERLAPVAGALYPAGLDALSARGLDANTLAARLGHDGPVYDEPRAALAAARRNAAAGDRIVVCGSFFTVAQARSPDHE